MSKPKGLDVTITARTSELAEPDAERFVDALQGEGLTRAEADRFVAAVRRELETTPPAIKIQL